MKTASAIVLLSLFGLLAGCSTSSAPEPAPGPTEKPAVVDPARPLGQQPTDVVAQKIYARPPLSVIKQLVQHSTALPPTERLGSGYAPQETTHTDILHILPKGSAGTYKVQIDTTAGDAYLFLSPQVDGHPATQAALSDIEVFDPNGVRINGRAPKNDVQVNTDSLAMSAIPLDGHPAGAYTVKFKSGAPQTGLAIEARLLASKIVLKLKPSTTQHLFGNQTFVDATLLDGTTPITGARVVADLVDGETGRTVAPIVFDEVGAGVYRAAIHSVLGESHKVAAYLTDVRAEGTSPLGTQFFRHGRTGFHYGIATARLAGVVAQRTITDDKGMISAFEVDVNLESRSLDRLELSAKLTVLGADGEEHPIGIAHTGDAFDAGNHVVTLRFDAGHVRLTKAEGTLFIRDLQLFSLGTNTLFHRELAGQDRFFARISRTSLRPLVDLAPAQSQLVADGVFAAD